MRIASIPSNATPSKSLDFRRVTGGFLVQDSDFYTKGEFKPKTVSKRQPTDTELSDAAIQHLASHNFPGNIRELYAIIRRAAILSDSRVIDKPQLQIFEYDFEPPTPTTRVLSAENSKQRRKNLPIRRPRRSPQTPFGKGHDSQWKLTTVLY